MGRKLKLMLRKITNPADMCHMARTLYPNTSTIRECLGSSFCVTDCVFYKARQLTASEALFALGVNHIFFRFSCEAGETVALCFFFQILERQPFTSKLGRYGGSCCKLWFTNSSSPAEMLVWPSRSHGHCIGTRRYKF